MVCSFRFSVRTSVRKCNFPPSCALKFLKWCISQQLLITKHSYLDHNYPRGLAFTPWPRSPGSMPRVGARGQNLEHLKKCLFFLSFVMKSIQYVDTWPTNYQKASIYQLIWCSVGFDSSTISADIRVHV